MSVALIPSSPAAFGVTGSGATVAVTIGAAVSVGHSILVGVEIRSGDGVSLTNVTDNLGNTYVQAIAPFDEATNTGRILHGWICKTVTTGGTPVITANFTGAAFARAIHVAAFSGMDATAPVDKTSTGTAASGTAIATGSMTPAEDNEAFWGFTEATAEVPAAGSGFTILATNAVGGQSATDYKIQTTASAGPVTFTTSVGGAWAVIGCTLKQAAGGGGGVVPQSGRWASNFQAVGNLDEDGSEQPVDSTGAKIRVLETPRVLPGDVAVEGGQGTVALLETQVVVLSHGT